MTPTRRFTPEQEAKLTARAAKRGMTLEAWLKKLDEDAYPYQSIVPLQTIDPEEWIRQFDEWCESHRHYDLPHLSDDDLRRENIY